MDAHQQYLLSRGLARWYRGRLIPVMRGGDSLFPELPRTPDGAVDNDALAALSDEDLAGLITASRDAMGKIKAQDTEFLAGLSGNETLEAMKSVVFNIQTFEAEQGLRAEAQQNLADELTALSATVDPAATLAAESGDGGEGDGDGSEGGDGDGDGDAAAAADAETIVATAEPEPQRQYRRVPPAATGLQALDTEQSYGMTLTASANIDGFQPGQTLDGSDGASPLNRALVAAIRRKTATPKGFRDEVVVASADIREQVPEFRRLRGDDADPERFAQSNEDKVRALTAAADKHGVGYDGDDWGEAEALTASGGICAPVTPYYELAFVSSMLRPFRDSLVGFIGDRGGINYAPPPYLEQITTGVGVMTATQDSEGGTKTCQTLICPEFSSVDVQQIWHCFTGGNLGQRAFPEQAAQFGSLILAQHARVCETQLINQVKAGSTNVLGQRTVLGAISSIFNDMVTSAAAYRSNNRMPRNARLEVRAPQWVGDLMLIDLLQSQFDRFSKDQAGLEELFAQYNLGITFFMDGPTDGDGQVLPRQTGSLGSSAPGYLEGFPTVIEYNICHPGGILFVDSGVLELGIVRDSVLNASNSYQVWGESFEVAVVVAVQSLWISSNVCPTGAVALPIDNSDQCGT